MHILYCLTFSNGKKYIGQTVRTMHLRLLQHKRSAKSGSLLPVHCAWRVHGDPMVDVLSTHETAESLHQAEIAAIAEQNTQCPNGYNVALGGETSPAKSPEVAAKISAKAKGRKIKDTSGHSNALRALWSDADYRKKVTDGVNASWTDERRASAAAKSKEMWAKRKADGWVMSESHRQALRIKPVSDEARRKMSEAAKGKPKAPRSEETRAKLAESIKRSWSDPEIRARRLSAIKAAKAAM